MPRQISSALITFAFVHETFEKTGDIYQGLMPLFAPLIKLRHHVRFVPSTFAADVDRYYGIRMHSYVAEDWAPRLANANLLSEHDLGNGIKEYLNGDPDVPAIGELDKSVDSLLGDFKMFISSQLAEHDIKLSDEKIEAAIFQRFSSMEFLNALSKPEVSFAKSKTLSLPNVPASARGESQETADPMEAHLDVLCAAYAWDLFSDHPGKFELLADICGGALISEVVLGLRVPPSLRGGLSHMTVYVDSPLLLDLLDVGLAEDRESARFLLDELRSLGAKIATFRHNVEEMQKVLHAVVTNVEQGERLFGPFATRMASDPTAVSRARDIQAHLDYRLMDSDIAIVDAANDGIALKRHFSESLEQDLIASIRRHRNIDPRVVDGRSISAVMRRVLSSTPVSSVLSCNAIFLSRNTALVKTAHRFLEHHGVLREAQPAPIVSDRYMAGLLFAVKGGAGAEIPKKKLIANCAAAVRPRRDVVVRMHRLLSQMSPESVHEFEALMRERRSTFYLMTHSLGDADLITEGNAPALLEKMKLATAADVTRAKDAEREQELAAREEMFKQERESKAATEKSLRDSLVQKEAEIRRSRAGEVAARQELEEKRHALFQREKRIVESCMRRGFRSGYLCVGSISLGLAALGFMISIALQEVETFKNPGMLVISFGVALVVFLLALGVIQSPIFHDLLFGKWVQSARERVFFRSIAELGSEDLLNRFSVDWRKKKIVAKGEVPDDLSK